jgi:hypothetical protein
MSEEKNRYVVRGYSEDILLNEHDEYVTAAEHIAEIEQKLSMAAKNAEYREGILNDRIALLEAENQRLRKLLKCYADVGKFTASVPNLVVGLQEQWDAK